MFGAIAGGIASALAGGAMSKLFGGGQKAASGGIQGDVLATDNNTVGMGDAGIKSAIQGSNVPNPDEAVPSFVSGAMAKAGKGLLEGTLQAGTSAVSDKLLDLVGLGGKSAADKGKDTRDYLAAAFPELNAWERAGADASSAGMVDAGFENQKELTKMQLDNQKEIAEMQNETQKEIAGIQSATSRQNTKDQEYAQNEMLAYQQKESTARVASIMEYTNLSKQQQVSEIMLQMITQAQTHGQYFTNYQINERTRKASAAQIAASGLQLGEKLADHCDIVARLEACGGDQRATSHGTQGMLQLTQAIGWIDVDQDQAGLGRRKLRNSPFRAVRGPDADAVAWLKAEGQKPRGESVAARLEFRVSPANLLVCNNQRFARSVSRAHFVQKGADGLADQGRAAVTMHIAFTLHEYLRSASFLNLRPGCTASLGQRLLPFEHQRWRLDILV